MTHYLVATVAAATTEAACGYLQNKLDRDDAVYVLTVDVIDEQDERQAALDTAQAELTDLVDVRTFRRAGSPGQEIVNFVREHDIDEIHHGTGKERRHLDHRLDDARRSQLRRKAGVRAPAGAAVTLAQMSAQMPSRTPPTTPDATTRTATGSRDGGGGRSAERESCRCFSVATTNPAAPTRSANPTAPAALATVLSMVPSRNTAP